MEDWNLVPFLDHHRCFFVYKKYTRAVSIQDQLFFQHHYLTSPTVTKKGRFVVTAYKITQSLKSNNKVTLMKDYYMLVKVANIFNQIA